MTFRNIGVATLATVAVGSLAGLGYAAPRHALSAAEQYQPHKVQVCHNGHTITISQSALKAHLKHHDTLGPCAPGSKHDNGKHKGKGHGK